MRTFPRSMAVLFVAVLTAGGCGSGSGGEGDDGDPCSVPCGAVECGSVGDCSCASCTEGYVCTGNTCVPDCPIACTGVECGEVQGCNCGSCGAEAICEGYVCKAKGKDCPVLCGAAECGEIQGCNCGSCGAGETCASGVCIASVKPCLSLVPEKLDFGVQAIGTEKTLDLSIVSCGLEPLEIYGIELGIASSPHFTLNFFDPADPPTPEDPIVISQMSPFTLQVRYMPIAPSPGPDEGNVVIESNLPDSPHVVPLSGQGTDKPCTIAVIKVQEGNLVCPQTKLHLIGSQSYGGSGTIQTFEWSVEQPPGSASVFLPSAAAPDPTIEANTAGAYEFNLRVWDDAGLESCAPAEYTVLVQPCNQLHVELLWHTPGDDDETDEGPEAGADLDLHFTHPLASGPDVDEDGEPDPWFDDTYDCFWFGPTPDWDPVGPGGEDPSFDRDDTDGAGPEIINMTEPEAGLTYRIGVDYWNDNGFGPSKAIVRVYTNGTKTFETSLDLVIHDMWYVGDLSWPLGTVTPKTRPDGSPWVTPNYLNPLFPWF